MDSVSKKQLYINQHEKKCAEATQRSYDHFIANIEPLQKTDIQYYIYRIVSDHDYFKLREYDPYYAKLMQFPFEHDWLDMSRLNNSLKIIQKDVAAGLQEIRAHANIGHSRVTVFWKGYNPILEICFDDLITVANDILFTSDDIYLFDMFSNWIIELHHDNYLTYGES